MTDPFWCFVPRRPTEPDACWIWRGGMDGRERGTPIVTVDGRMTTAGRVAWERQYGSPPDGYVYRTCGNRRCVRPQHLRRRRREGMVGKGHGTWGESNGKATLTDADVFNMRLLYERGASQTQLARYFDISQPAVSYIVRGESRRAAGGPIFHGQARVQA